MKLDEEMKMGLHKLLDSMNELYGVGYKESGPFEAFIVRSIEPYQEGNKYMVNIDIIHNQNHYYYVDPWREEIPNLYEHLPKGYVPVVGSIIGMHELSLPLLIRSLDDAIIRDY
ncbi:TPA: hypothetical protein HA239_03080 [Candidatus Woesearchaeota archaeon]|nr:hypothetical protein QT06_C0001G0690 [archaeon GW2011_AR15]MBS3103523.1 hypothetical protein [Candidatus Woesearchaeota archaeon]HIH41373.1 hypothetical protein [Candidatus Woesearchaeota archaeon]